MRVPLQIHDLIDSFVGQWLFSNAMDDWNRIIKTTNKKRGRGEIAYTDLFLSKWKNVDWLQDQNAWQCLESKYKMDRSLWILRKAYNSYCIVVCHVMPYHWLFIMEKYSDFRETETKLNGTIYSLKHRPMMPKQWKLWFSFGNAAQSSIRMAKAK